MHQLRTIIVVAVAAAVALWFAWEGGQRQHPWTSEEVGPVDPYEMGMVGAAQGIDDLVAGAYYGAPEGRTPYDIIVVGVPTAVLEIVPELTPTPPPDGYADAEEATAVAEAFDWDYTHYLIDVERVVLDDGLLASGGRLVVRMSGTPPETEAEERAEKKSAAPMDKIGERYLYFLQESADVPGTYVAHHASVARLHVSGRSVRYSDGPRTRVGYAKGRNPDDFIDDVAAAVAVAYGAEER